MERRIEYYGADSFWVCISPVGVAFRFFLWILITNGRSDYDLGLYLVVHMPAGVTDWIVLYAGWFGFIRSTAILSVSRRAACGTCGFTLLPSSPTSDTLFHVICCHAYHPRSLKRSRSPCSGCDDVMQTSPRPTTSALWINGVMQTLTCGECARPAWLSGMQIRALVIGAYHYGDEFGYRFGVC